MSHHPQPIRISAVLKVVHAMSKHVFGIVRYSVVTAANIKNWRTTRVGTLQEASTRILSEQRLRIRQELFKATALPFFRQEWGRGESFKVLVLISPLLPTRWRDQLVDATRDLVDLHLVEVPIDSSVALVTRNTVLSYLRESNDVVLTFRLDDDDCLRSGMISRLREHVVPHNAEKILSFEHGLYCGLDSSDALTAKRIVYRSNAFGISYVSTAGQLSTVFDIGSHSKLGALADQMIVDPWPDAWLRSIHAATDTQQAMSEKGVYVSNTSEVLASAYDYLDLGKLSAAYRLARNEPD